MSVAVRRGSLKSRTMWDVLLRRTAGSLRKQQYLPGKAIAAIKSASKVVGYQSCRAASGSVETCVRFFLKFSFSWRAWQMRQTGVVSSDSLLKIGALQRTHGLEIPAPLVFFKSFIESNSIPFARLPIVPNESAARGQAGTNNFRAHAITLA